MSTVVSVLSERGEEQKRDSRGRPVEPFSVGGYDDERTETSGKRTAVPWLAETAETAETPGRRVCGFAAEGGSMTEPKGSKAVWERSSRGKREGEEGILGWQLQGIMEEL